MAVKLGFLLRNGKKIRKKGELGIDGDDAQRAKEGGNIFGGVLWMYSGGALASLAFVLKERTAMGQIKLVTARIHDRQPQRGLIRTCLCSKSTSPYNLNLY
jgi:hypothetical protein